jgi:hypothetical protein
MYWTCEFICAYVRAAAAAAPPQAVIMLAAVGVQVPPKFYRYNATVVWSPPVDCPVTWQPGPYAMAKVSMK